VKFEHDPRRLIPVEYQKNFTQREAYDLIDKFRHYNVDNSGCIDGDELKLLLADFDANQITINKIMAAIDGNRDGRVAFNEVAALVAKVKRYKMDQLLPMSAMKGAVSSDGPSFFKLQGGAVLDRTLGPNFPVRYTHDPRYKVATPEDPQTKRANELKEWRGQKGTSVSYMTPAEFKIPRIQVEPNGQQSKTMVPEAQYGWSEQKWDGPWDMPQSYMVPANVEPGQIQTNANDRLYGTVKGQYPPHMRNGR